MMRDAIQSGFGRKPIAFFIGAASFFVLFYFWDDLVGVVQPLDGFSKVAFIAAAFSITAYNLRTRVIDLVLKLDGAPSQIRAATAISRDCGRKLTNLVLLFTVTAIFMASGAFINDSSPVAKWFASTVFGVFSFSIVHFIYILFAFERLERFMLDDAEKKCERRESDRLLKNHN